MPVTINGADLVVEQIPAAVKGQIYVVLTKDAGKATDDTIVAGPIILEVFPMGHVPLRPPPSCS